MQKKVMYAASILSGLSLVMPAMAQFGSPSGAAQSSPSGFESSVQYNSSVGATNGTVSSTTSSAGFFQNLFDDENDTGTTVTSTPGLPATGTETDIDVDADMNTTTDTDVMMESTNDGSTLPGLPATGGGGMSHAL